MKCSTILAALAFVSLFAAASARADDSSAPACEDAEVQAPSPGDGWTATPPSNAGVHCRWTEAHPGTDPSIIVISVDPAPSPSDPAGWLDATLAPLRADGYRLGDKDRFGKSGATIDYADADGTHFLQVAVRGPHGRIYSAQLRCPLPTAFDQDRETLMRVAGGLHAPRPSAHRGS